MEKSNFVGTIILSIFLFLLVLTTSNNLVFVGNEEITVLDHYQYKIHVGDHYFLNTYKDLTQNVNNSFVFTTEGVDAHILFDIFTNQETVVSFYEGADVNLTCSALSSFNNNRQSPNNSSIVWYEGCAVNDYGTLLTELKIGNAKKFGGESRQSNELNLKQNTTYILNFFTTQVGTYVSGTANWYEE